MAYEPTHDVPASGLPAFAEPDSNPGPAAQLVPGLDVQVLGRRDDWAQIECSNGWRAWVNGTLLVARTVAPPPPPAPEPTPPPPPPVPVPAPPPPPPVPVPAPPVAAPAPAPTPAAAAAPAAPAAAPGAPAPSGAWAAPSAGGAAVRTSGGLALGVGQIVTLVGAALVLVSGWLKWVDVEAADFTASAYKVPATFLKDNTVDIPDAGLNLGILLLLLAAACVVGAFVAQVRWLAVVGGVLALVVGVVFLYQIKLIADDLDSGVFDLAGYAPILTVFGGIVATVGGALALAQKR